MSIDLIDQLDAYGVWLEERSGLCCDHTPVKRRLRQRH